MEEESSTTTARIQYALSKRIDDAFGHDLFSQPARRVVLAKPVTCLWADDRLIELLHDIRLGIFPCKSGQSARKALDKPISAGDFDNPVKEVSFDHAANLGFGEPRAGHDCGGIELRIFGRIPSTTE
jgi:hypothetical protein